MYRIVLVICILSLLLLQACDSASNDEQEDFSITLNLTDASGAPLSDYAVTIFQNCYQDLFRFGMAKPSTSFGLAVAEGCRADIKITDSFWQSYQKHQQQFVPRCASIRLERED